MKQYMQYLVVLLDDTSAAYCHAENPLKVRNLMPLETLREAILFGMKQNLMIQFVYPDYELPEAYNALIETIDHVKIGREVRICNGVEALPAEKTETVVLRLTLAEFLAKAETIAENMVNYVRLNICLTDTENFKDEQKDAYSLALNTLVEKIAEQYKAGNQVQVNILTDRLQLTEMHNCDAGIGNITLAPNGKFYLCPAFYYDEKTGISNRMNHKTGDASRSVGDLQSGIQIPNKQLLQLDHAPLCRNCDAYHCNRCIWLNQKLTWDNNTPSHQQCVLSHIERNAARELSIKLHKAGLGLPEIKEIDYLDPFDVKEEW